jgi:hypothetical protein
MGGGYLCFFGANLHYFSIWVMENLDPEIYWIIDDESSYRSPFRSLENHIIIAVIIVAQLCRECAVTAKSPSNFRGANWLLVELAQRIFHCHLWVGHRRV